MWRFLPLGYCACQVWVSYSCPAVAPSSLVLPHAPDGSRRLEALSPEDRGRPWPRGSHRLHCVCDTGASAAPACPAVHGGHAPRRPCLPANEPVLSPPLSGSGLVCPRSSAATPPSPGQLHQRGFELVTSRDLGSQRWGRTRWPVTQAFSFPFPVCFSPRWPSPAPRCPGMLRPAPLQLHLKGSRCALLPPGLWHLQTHQGSMSDPGVQGTLGKSPNLWGLL